MTEVVNLLLDSPDALEIDDVDAFLRDVISVLRKLCESEHLATKVWSDAQTWEANVISLFNQHLALL